MIEEFASRMFTARDIAHREHLRIPSRSYAQHIALGEFYAAITEQTDEIIESYQGQFGIVGDWQVETSPVMSITPWLQAELDWLTTNRDAIANGNASIANLLDGLASTFQRTIYKLSFLT